MKILKGKRRKELGIKRKKIMFGRKTNKIKRLEMTKVKKPIKNGKRQQN